MAAVEENGDFALTKAQLDRRWGGGGRGYHCEATNELSNAFFAVASAHDDGDTRSETGKLLRLGAARGGGEREAMELASAFGQALAFFWRSNARRGGFGRA